MKYFILGFYLLMSFKSYGQTELKGVVMDRDGTGIQAASLRLKNAKDRFAIADYAGNFILRVPDLSDSVLVTSMGYASRTIALADLALSGDNRIVLRRKALSIAEVMVKAEDPISSRFAVTKIEKMDIYMNPLAQGDPLKAITLLPSSTTLDESASPSLRGSSSARSSVRLNGVPLLNPVRLQSVSTQGFFSLFNPEMIEKQYVYASNPPLIYGNTSAGLVDVHTNRPPLNNQVQLSTSLANLGGLLTRNLANGKALIQVYSNIQFSDLLTGIQKNSFPTVQDFSSQDAGLAYHHKINRNMELKSYAYFINEAYNGSYHEHGYNGPLRARNKRFLTANSLNYYTSTGIFMFNAGYDVADSEFKYGNMRSQSDSEYLFGALNFKKFIGNSIDLQIGADLTINKRVFHDSVPSNYYAIAPSAANEYVHRDLLNSNLESYLYANWRLSTAFSVAVGARNNIPIAAQEGYLSYQLGLNYNPTRQHTVILGGGRYHNYGIPSMYLPKFTLMKSDQLAIDYQFKKGNLLLKTALYYKKETGEQQADLSNELLRSDGLRTFGAEISYEQIFYQYYKVALSNSFIQQKIAIDGQNYPGPSDLSYFVKSFIQYNNPRLFSVSLTYLTRPGTYFNRIDQATYNSDLDQFFPLFNNDYFNSQLPRYSRFDLSLSKFFLLKPIAVAAFLSVNNVFNHKNAMRPIYTADYRRFSYDYLQRRTVYFGAVWYLNN